MVTTNFTNAGNVNATGNGKFIIGPSNSSTHSGTFNSTSASGLEFINAGQNFNSSSSFTGSGLITFNGGAYDLNGSFTNSNTKVSNGTASFNMGSVNFGILSVTGGTLTGTAFKTLSSTMNWYGGTLSGTGSFTINSGATCNLGNPSNMGIGILQTSLTNGGTIIWNNNYPFSCCSPVTFNMTGGALLNNGTFTITNSGSINTMTIFGGTFSNSYNRNYK